jgi:deazaflavin-dependent oxidoreductase (nitroreductase family)
MELQTAAALEAGGLCDITTIGAKSGRPRRIEIVFHHFDGQYFITGRPGAKRDWLANLLTNPEFTLHLKGGRAGDLGAKAEAITDDEERAAVLYRILTESWDNEPSKANHILPRWVAGAPLVKFGLLEIR